MNPLWLASLTSPEWTNVVKALLHTLWQGTILAIVLGLILRRLNNPRLRYRCTFATLVGVVLAGLITWGVLSKPLPQAAPQASAPAAVATTPIIGVPDAQPLVVNFSAPVAKPQEFHWTAWLALLWVAGATVMLGRAGFQVAGAERLRRTSRPLDDPRILALLAEARKAVGLARRVRLAVTEQLSSPAVAGVLVPTLILPLSLTTSLTPDQIRFVLLHELAHIRRGDYLANLFQLFAEALLFFNPAVWWISRQMRIEREACCDALAVQLSGAPADYARTLVRVVEHVLNPASAAAPAFGGPREPSSLADRLQRMLVPGYRPALRLTWRAMFAALLTGGTLLVLTALGTRVTIAAMLTPQERIDRIEKKMTEYGQPPKISNGSGNESQVKLSGHVRMADGSKMPQWGNITAVSSGPQASYSLGEWARNGEFSFSIQAGAIYLGAKLTNTAPVVIGPLDGFATNSYDNLNFVLESGFDVPLQVIDTATGKPMASGSIVTDWSINGYGFGEQTLQLGPDGQAVVIHCADVPLDVTANVPGHEILKKHFDHLQAGKPLQISLPLGATIAGIVQDRVTGKPLPGAVFHLLYQTGENPEHYEWNDALHVLGQSETDGSFNLNQLRHGFKYYLGVSAPGHGSVILEKIPVGTSGLVVQLGPELIVRGHVSGDLTELPQIDKYRTLDLNYTEHFENNGYGHSEWVPIHTTNGEATFQFTNPTPGTVTLSGGSYREDRTVTAPIDDWTVDLQAAKTETAKDLPKREVIFRFKYTGNVPPKGTVSVTIPDDLNDKHRTAHMQDFEITNGEVHASIAIGGETHIQPQNMVGYWFNEWSVGYVTVTNGASPMVFEIPVIPAGAIYAKALNADGTPAGGLLFGVTELKRAPGRNENSSLGNNFDSVSGNAPRKWVSSPLPLGGTYQIHAWRGNSFCISQPIKLTEANPDAEVQLQFPPGKNFTGTLLNPDGKPLANAEVKVNLTQSNAGGFDLKSVSTDEQGRFELHDMTPDLATYAVQADAPGLMAELVKLKFNGQPQAIQLKPGHVLGGHVVDAATGYPIPDTEVRVWTQNDSLPQQTSHTDADGYFEFNTLGDSEYTLFTQEGQEISNQKFRADGNTNLTVRIKLYAWSKAQPKAPAARMIPTTSSRKATLQKLDQIRVAVAAYDHLSLAEVLRQLTAQSWQNDPEKTGLHFEFRDHTQPDAGPAYLDPNTGLPLASDTTQSKAAADLIRVNIQPELRDVTLKALLSSIVLNSFPPAQYNILPDGTVEFSTRSSLNAVYTQTFVLNPYFEADLLRRAGLSASGTNQASTIVASIRKLARDAGVDWDSLAGKSIFYDNWGHLSVKATPADLMAVEKIISEPREPAPTNNTSLGVNSSTNHLPAEKIVTLSYIIQRPISEDALKKSLLAAGVTIPQTTIFYAYNGKFLARGTPEQLALVHNVVLQLNGFASKDPAADAKNFIASFEKPKASQTDDDTTLIARTFRVDTNTFAAFLQKQNSADTNNPFVNLFENQLGLDWKAPAGKAVFYKPNTGILFVKATASDLDTIERTLQILTTSETPQVHIKVRVIKIPNNGSSSPNLYLGNLTPIGNSTPAKSPASTSPPKISVAKLLINSANDKPALTGILTVTNLQTVLSALNSRTDAEILGEPEVTTLSGRQSQMRCTESIFVLTNNMVTASALAKASAVKAANGSVQPVSTPEFAGLGEQVEVGPIVDIIPRVLADNYTINIKTTPSITEFLGYDPMPADASTAPAKSGDERLRISPKFRVQEASTTLINIWDGQTIVLSGLPQKTVNGTNGVATPVASAPGIFIFITATLVDSTGNRIHKEDELAFTQTNTPPQPEQAN